MSGCSTCTFKLMSNYIDSLNTQLNERIVKRFESLALRHKLSIAGFRTGVGTSGFSQNGLSQKGHTSHTCCTSLFQVRTSHVATCCNILPHVATCCSHSPMKVDWGELRHFCDDPSVLTLSGSYQCPCFAEPAVLSIFMGTSFLRPPTVSSPNFNSQHFRLRVSSPRTIACFHLSTPF